MLKETKQLSELVMQAMLHGLRWKLLMLAGTITFEIYVHDDWIEKWTIQKEPAIIAKDIDIFELQGYLYDGQ